MGIESLNKAALAAGFAMATPDDDPHVEQPDHQPADGRWRPFLGEVDYPLSTRRSMAAAVGWLRERWALRGGGAPA